jgi:TolB protein
MNWLSKFLWLGIFAVVTTAQAQRLVIDVTKGMTDPIPIAVTTFQSVNELGPQISKIIASDLQSSGLFRPIEQRAFIQDSLSAHSHPRFADWRMINAQALITGVVTTEGDTVKVEFRVFDVFSGKQIDGKVLKTTLKNWRRLGHMAADVIYSHLTGEEGYFDTRIVYISESGPASKRVKRLAIMDYDGQNHHFISDGKQMVITPRFSPSTQLVAYMAFLKKSARVYILDLRTGRRKIVGHFDGMTFAPRFSPDGERIVMSLAKEGRTCLYSMDLRTGRVSQLTNTPFIDTSPSFSPDGRKITFNSDRGGSQQLYIMNADGSDQQRISFGSSGWYATPVWSPRGDLIAFTRCLEGSFYIGVMRPDGTGERLLTKGDYLVESPTWAPNGRVIIFTKEYIGSNGRKLSKLYSIDLTGFYEREIVTPLEASDPAWSPLLTK